MNPVHALAVLFWGAVILSAVSGCVDAALRSNLRQHWKPIATILLVTAIWRVPPDGEFFHGLEYEDSYVYTVAGRQIYEHAVGSAWTDDTPLSVNVCEIGSIRACREWEPFPEHLLGYPYIVSVAAHIIGYNPSIGSIINFIAALLAAILVYTLTLRLSGVPATALFAGVTYAAIPVSAVYGLETSAEPFSALCVLFALHLFMNVLDGRTSSGARYRRQAADWGAYTAVLLLSVVTKREDVILAIVFPVVALAAVLASRGNRWEYIRPLILLVLSSLVAVFLISRIHLFQTSINERELLTEFPLTASRLWGFVVSFLSSFLSGRWYAFSFVPVLIGSVAAFKRRDRTSVPMLLLACFVLVYASHVRSYYEMKSGHVEVQAALRFSMNLMGLWAISVGFGLEVLKHEFKRIRSKLGLREVPAYGTVLASIMCLAGLYLLTYHLRDYETEDERISRVTPALDADEVASSTQEEQATVLTMDPLVIQMYANASARIADLESLDTSDIQSLVRASPLVFLKENARFADADLSRYGEPIQYLLSLPAHLIKSGEGYEVLRIDRQALDPQANGTNSASVQSNRYNPKPS